MYWFANYYRVYAPDSDDIDENRVLKVNSSYTSSVLSYFSLCYGMKSFILQILLFLDPDVHASTFEWDEVKYEQVCKCCCQCNCCPLYSMCALSDCPSGWLLLFQAHLRDSCLRLWWLQSCWKILLMVVELNYSIQKHVERHMPYIIYTLLKIGCYVTPYF